MLESYTRSFLSLRLSIRLQLYIHSWWLTWWVVHFLFPRIHVTKPCLDSPVHFDYILYDRHARYYRKWVPSNWRIRRHIKPSTDPKYAISDGGHLHHPWLSPQELQGGTRAECWWYINGNNLIGISVMHVQPPVYVIQSLWRTLYFFHCTTGPFICWMYLPTSSLVVAVVGTSSCM